MKSQSLGIRKKGYAIGKNGHEGEGVMEVRVRESGNNSSRLKSGVIKAPPAEPGTVAA